MKLPMMQAMVNGTEMLVSATTAAYNRSGIIPINQEINKELAQEVEALIYQADSDVTLVINSFGGDVDAAHQIISAMEHCGHSVTTFCVGTAASAAALILAAGTKGKRYADPRSFVMIHQVSGSFGGTTSDVQIVAEHMKKVNQNTDEMLSLYTGVSLEQIAIDTARDKYMCAEEAQKYGLIDNLGIPDGFYK